MSEFIPMIPMGRAKNYYAQMANRLTDEEYQLVAKCTKATNQYLEMEDELNAHGIQAMGVVSSISLETRHPKVKELIDEFVLKFKDPTSFGKLDRETWNSLDRSQMVMQINDAALRLYIMVPLHEEIVDAMGPRLHFLYEIYEHLKIAGLFLDLCENLQKLIREEVEIQGRYAPLEPFELDEVKNMYLLFATTQNYDDMLCYVLSKFQ